MPSRASPATYVSASGTPVSTKEVTVPLPEDVTRGVAVNWVCGVVLTLKAPVNQIDTGIVPPIKPARSETVGGVHLSGWNR